MEFSQSLQESYSQLRSALGPRSRALKAGLSMEDTGRYPLLIMKTSGDLIGFVAVDRSPEASFKSAYDTFKLLYRENHTEWKRRNLSFVVCHPSLDESHKTFFNTIELDAYFCRKYVLGSLGDKDAFGQELHRLPFLPLPDGEGELAGRPPTAQTLLQSHGVSGEFARRLIVPGISSASRLAKEVIQDRVVLPDISSDLNVDHSSHFEPKENVRLQSLTVEAFRAYRKKQEFDLDADIIVLYGPNGLGKTSFFDAIDYACTGRVGRLCRRRVTQNQFRQLARHLDMPSTAGSVRLTVNQDSSTQVVTRQVNEWRYATINTDKIDRGDLMQVLTSSEWGAKKPQVANLESLFRATHFFSQSSPEFLINFEEYSTLSADHVSRALALDDYTAGLSKINDVMAVLSKEISDHDDRLSSINGKIGEEEIRRKSLPALDVAESPGPQLQGMAAELAKDMQVQASLSVVDSDISSEAVREWRALIESSLSNSARRITQLSSLESDFGKFIENQAAENNVGEKLISVKNAAKSNASKLSQQQHAHEKTTEVCERRKTELAEVRKKRHALEQLAQIQESSTKAQSSLLQWRAELTRIENDIANDATSYRSLARSVDDLEKEVAELTLPRDAYEKRIQALANIQNGLAKWQTEKGEVDELDKRIADKRVKNEQAVALLEMRISEIASLEQQLSTCEKELEAQIDSNAGLTRLLDEIEVFAKNESCPACGTDHGSNATLIEKIRSQKESRPANVETLAGRVSALKTSIVDSEAARDVSIAQRDAAALEIQHLLSRRAGLLQSITTMEELLEGVSLLASDESIQSTLPDLLTTARESFSSSAEAINAINEKLAEASAKMETLQERQAQQDEMRTRVIDAIEPLDKQLSEAREKATTIGLSLEMEEVRRSSEMARLKESEIKLSKQVDALEVEVRTIATAVENAKVAHMESIRVSDATEEEKLAVEMELSEYARRATEVFGHDEFSDDVIKSERADEAERQAALAALTRRAISLERALDSAQRSVAIAELDASLRSLIAQRDELVEQIAGLNAARNWFGQLREIVGRQNADAIASHVRAFGPLTTIVQKRLRPVYGFGDVRMMAKDKEIHVAVERNGGVLKPSDYFSDSQKQILMLSIFLASRLTQTWSGFAPILMDDPVTHFDDLNAFSFVELIRGLISHSPGKRQFIVSTCEVRLFELMRKKFEGVDGGALFYQFGGINSDGPVVSRLD